MTHSIKCVGDSSTHSHIEATVQNKLVNNEHNISWQKHDIKIQGEIFCTGGGF